MSSIEGFENTLYSAVILMLMAICINGMTDQEVLDLTDIFINSGEILDLSSVEGVKVDKHFFPPSILTDRNPFILASTGAPFCHSGFS